MPPPASWGVALDDVSTYSHINVKINRISLSPSASGVLGETKQLTYDENGKSTPMFVVALFSVCFATYFSPSIFVLFSHKMSRFASNTSYSMHCALERQSCVLCTEALYTGEPIMVGKSEDGAGVINGNAADYVVESMF